MRVQMHEPYRTLLGHFRHEVGHYYWDRLIAETRWQEGYRNLFGDERASYADALDHHYKNGAPDNWQESSVSAYATMHPWEDWAETWAHYLHMMDAVDTALGFGMSARDMELDYQHSRWMFSTIHSTPAGRPSCRSSTPGSNWPACSTNCHAAWVSRISTRSCCHLQ